jgi:hypothetical protein
LDCMPPAYMWMSFWNHKDAITQNCLFVSSFNMRFLYALTRWEELATDAHVYEDAWWYTLGTIPTHRPKQTKGFWSISFKLQKSQQLLTYTKLTTSHSPFYHIKPSKCPVFSVCPACYHPSPISCVLFLSLIMFKIIPHPMTLLIVFPLQVIVSYFILHHFSSLPCHLMAYPLPSSHIPSPHICHTCRLHPLSYYKRCTPFVYQ